MSPSKEECTLQNRYWTCFSWAWNQISFPNCSYLEFQNCYGDHKPLNQCDILFLYWWLKSPILTMEIVPLFPATKLPLIYLRNSSAIQDRSFPLRCSYLIATFWIWTIKSKEQKLLKKNIFWYKIWNLKDQYICQHIYNAIPKKNKISIYY